jgi:hypothetical protein
MAERIVDHFGPATLEVIEQDAEPAGLVAGGAHFEDGHRAGEVDAAATQSCQLAKALAAEAVPVLMHHAADGAILRSGEGRRQAIRALPGAIISSAAVGAAPAESGLRRADAGTGRPAPEGGGPAWAHPG